jgi:hypothetical protein
MSLAGGWAQNYQNQSNFTTYGSNCAGASVTGGTQTAPTQLTDTCTLVGPPGVYNTVVQSGAISYPLCLVVGSPSQNGGVYSIAPIASATFCHDVGPPPVGQNGCIPDGSSAVTEDVLTVWTY